MQWINDNSNGITAIATVSILLATLAYVWVNSRMHAEMKMARILAQTPALSIRLERIMSGFFDLVIENTSGNPAYEIQFTDYPSPDQLGIDSLPKFFHDGIRYMAPGQKYRTFFLNYPDVVRRYKGRPTDLTIAYHFIDNRKRKQNDVITFNIAGLYDSKSLGTGVEIHENLAAMHGELRAIREQLEKFLKQRKE